jgi:hypothetical protein
MTKKLTLEECQKIAEKRGGKCLSFEYINAYTKMDWECANGHQWQTKFQNIKYSNSWCKICYNNSLKLTLENCQKIAEERGGKCLSS